jgi:hypothetical protein
MSLVSILNLVMIAPITVSITTVNMPRKVESSFSPKSHSYVIFMKCNNLVIFVIVRIFITGIPIRYCASIRLFLAIVKVE